MSLTYLYNKLENMSPREQYSYIKNILLRFQIRPKFDIDELFKDTDSKQSVGKNPLGYLVMHLTQQQLQELIPEYLRELVGGNTFSENDWIIYYTIDNVMQSKGCLTAGADKSDMLQVFNFGVVKYHPWSFLKLNPYTLVPALFRHLYKHYYISKIDEESGLPHLAHASCNIRMIELIREKHKNES